jgi:hypothetical protein
MEQQDHDMAEAARAMTIGETGDGFWDKEMLTMELGTTSDSALQERWGEQSIEYMVRMCVTLNTKKIEDSREAIAFVRSQLFPLDEPNFRGARELDPATADLREKSVLARVVYLAELDENLLTDDWSIADMGKIFTTSVALSNDAGQIQRKFSREDHIAHYDYVKDLCPDSDIVRTSLQKLLDTRVFYYSGCFLHPILSTKGFNLNWATNELVTPSGTKFKFARDEFGLGFGWLLDEAGFANELSSIAASTVRIVPRKLVAEHAVMHLLAKFIFNREGSKYTAVVRAAPDTDANFFAKYNGYGSALRKNIHTWLSKVEIPGNLAAGQWLPTYLHFAINWAMDNDKDMTWPRDAQVSSYLQKNAKAAFEERLSWLKGLKNSEQLALRLPSSPAGNLEKVLQDLNDRRNVHNVQARYNNVFNTADVDTGGFQHHEAANRQIYHYLVNRLKTTYARKYSNIFIFLEGASPLFDICKELYPNAVIEIFSTSGGRGVAKWVPAKGYTGATVGAHSLVIDDSGSSGDMAATNRQKTVNLAKVGENRIDYLVRWTMTPGCALARHQRGDEYEYDLPYDLAATMKLFYHADVFAGGKAHSPEYWTSLLGRITVPFDENDKMTGCLPGAINAPKKVFTSLVMKTVLMSIANAWRRVIWQFGLPVAFGARYYIDSDLWSTIAGHTGFGRIPRLQYMELKNFLAMKDVVVGHFADDGSPIDLASDEGQFAGEDITLGPRDRTVVASGRPKARRALGAPSADDQEEEEGDAIMRDAGPEKSKKDV